MSVHDLLAMRVIQPAYRAYRLTRPKLRRAMHTFEEGLRFRNEARGWSEERKLAWVQQRLRDVVRRAARDSVFYGERLRAAGFDPASEFTLADYALLPVLGREEIREAGESILSAGIDPAERRKDSTGGSTGVPTTIWTGPEERGWRESGIAYFMRRLGIFRGARTAYLWGHHLDPVQRDTRKQRVQDWLNNVRWFDCLRLAPDLLMRYHAELEEWRPACIIAYASALAALAEELESRGIRPSYPSIAMVTGAEKLGDEHRERVHRVFGRPVHERYGSRDVGLMAFQSSAPRDVAYEVDWANVLIEAESEEPDSPILITKLHADAMPMLRYRVGDIARFDPPLAPGRPAFALEAVVGRETDRVWLPNGRWVHGLSYPHLMKDFPVREFQVHQRADYHVIVRIVPKGSLPDDARERLMRTIALNLPGIDIRLELVDAIARTAANKLRPVISDVVPPGARRPA